jgi:nitroimidazol reductase NimA-like FMN-containing flavoprotein (pyridoxamine 5'-phosphate oxidase superfamily)
MNDTTDTAYVHLTPDECWALLRTTTVGRLAVTVAGAPEIFPVNYVVDHGTVVFRTAEGTKLAALTVAPQVAFEADGRLPGGAEGAGEADQAWSVVIKGRTREIDRLDEVVATADLPLSPWHASPKGRFVRVLPDEVTGRRFPVADAAAWETPLSGVRRAPHE